MSVTLSEIEVGMIAMVRGGFGRDAAKEVWVTDVEEDIKNGEQGIAYDCIDTDGGGWAYLHQVDSVRVNVDKDKLYHDFKEMACNASAVEIEGCWFVRHFNFDGSELQICYSDDDGGFEINVGCVSDAVDEGQISWDNDSQSFIVNGTEGEDYRIRFMNVVPIERKGFE